MQAGIFSTARTRVSLLLRGQDLCPGTRSTRRSEIYSDCASKQAMTGGLSDRRLTCGSRRLHKPSALLRRVLKTHSICFSGTARPVHGANAGPCGEGAIRSPTIPDQCWSRSSCEARLITALTHQLHSINPRHGSRRHPLGHSINPRHRSRSLRHRSLRHRSLRHRSRNPRHCSRNLRHCSINPRHGSHRHKADEFSLACLCHLVLGGSGASCLRLSAESASLSGASRASSTSWNSTHLGRMVPCPLRCLFPLLAVPRPAPLNRLLNHPLLCRFPRLLSPLCRLVRRRLPLRPSSHHPRSRLHRPLQRLFRSWLLRLHRLRLQHRSLHPHGNQYL